MHPGYKFHTHEINLACFAADVGDRPMYKADRVPYWMEVELAVGMCPEKFDFTDSIVCMFSESGTGA